SERPDVLGLPQQLELHYRAGRDLAPQQELLELEGYAGVLAAVRPDTRVGELHYPGCRPSTPQRRTSSSAAGVRSSNVSPASARSFSRRTTSSSARWIVSVVPFVPSTFRASATSSSSRLSDVRLTTNTAYILEMERKTYQPSYSYA